MKIFSKLYEWVYGLAEHPKAPWWLGGLSFAESSFFPIPPDVILAPMVVARRSHAWWFALITTVASVAGGVAGYFVGVFFFEIIGQPLIEFYHAEEKFAAVKAMFDKYGFWIVFIAGFTPIPYKLFTITAGVTSLAFAPFVIASLIGRGARFFLVAGLIRFGGAPFEAWLRKNADPIEVSALSTRCRSVRVVLQTVLVLFAGAIAVSCAGPTPVPVREQSGKARSEPVRVVRHGETLYSIAWEMGKDPKKLAQWNQLSAVDRVETGQRLRVEPPASQGAPENSPKTGQSSENIAWVWPTQATHISGFSPKTGRMGLEFVGENGQKKYLSAYAHNKRLLVSEGQWVESGQVVAEMGSSGTDKVKLHFEIRRNGDPVDPGKFLPKI